MDLVDVGANLTHSSFKNDVEEVLTRARAAGVRRLIVTGTSVEESGAALAFASLHEGVFCTAGVHPHHARDCDSSTIDSLRNIAKHPRVVAIGECGLDFNRNYSPHPDQEKWFVAQVEFAIELRKPLFLHSRDAFPRFFEILEDLDRFYAFISEVSELLAGPTPKPNENCLWCKYREYFTNPQDIQEEIPF